MKPGELKSKLQRGEPVLGVSLMFASPQLVELIGRLGFDWVLLDCEHGAISLESLELMAMAADAAGVAAIARPRSREPQAIQEVLERGVLGVQVPHVNTAVEAQGVVEAVKYHPLGRRGLAARTRPAGYGLDQDLEEYVRRANAETLVCIQVEQKLALRNLDSLLAVPEIDVVFLGPSDLSQSLGFPGQTDHPDVRAAMQSAFETIRRSGRIAGSAGDAERCGEYLQLGATYLYTHLPALLADGSRDFLALRNSGSPSPRAP